MKATGSRGMRERSFTHLGVSLHRGDGLFHISSTHRASNNPWKRGFQSPCRCRPCCPP